MRRFPVEFSHFFNGLCRKLWNGDIQEHISTRGPKFNDLTINRRIARLVAFTRNDHTFFITKSLFNSGDVILTIIVILIQNRYFSIRLIL